MNNRASRRWFFDASLFGGMDSLFGRIDCLFWLVGNSPDGVLK
jgi:hypothetical protein